MEAAVADVAVAPAGLPGDDEDHTDGTEEDMANLFSFGSGEVSESGDADFANGIASLSTSSNNNHNSTSATTSSSTQARGKDHGGGGADSPDSFLEMLHAETSGVVLDAGGVAADHDQETQDILDWLEDADDNGDAEEIVFTSALVPPQPPPPEPEPTVVPLPPAFASLAEALASKESSVEQIRSLFRKEQEAAAAAAATSSDSVLSGTQRAELYCRMVCHKSLEDIVSSSLADSFEQWKKTRSVLEDDPYTEWIRHQDLAHNICQETGRGRAECETDLIDLVLYHHHQKKSSSAAAAASNQDQDESPQSETTERDVLLPAVVAAILSAGVPVAGAAVVLAQIIPSFMPLLILPEAERWDAAVTLHSEFYLLACYHVPLLVFHLDRYLPGWQWPKLPEQTDADASAVSIGRNLKKQGQVPPSWLLSHLAGECSGTMLPASTVLMLWDGILTDQDNATRFFLTLAVLEQQAEILLLLTGIELIAALQKVWTLEDIDKTREPQDKEWRHEWWPRARALEAATPASALGRLERTEDVAVQSALKLRQERSEAALQARLEAEAAAHRLAQERKAEEARLRLSRARLVAFYRTHAPGKEDNIDKIMETYADRLEELDFKLRKKYGEGFNPALKPKVPKPPNKLLATMNQGFTRMKSDVGDEEVEEERIPDQVSVMVTAEEVLPVVCWSKEATAARGVQRRKRNVKDRKPLKFYVVDSRSEDAAQEQGRFPTAVSLSPEVLLDPERMQQNEEMFESLRGAVHIVIMGEGFNAIPRLYNQKLSPKLTSLMEEDESRTNLCALFFQKRGFCFLSVLDGGFCAAHSWLVREGPKHHLNASAVLIDYRPEASLFGQLETLHNASAKEKAQRKMTNLLESSMVTMTKRAQQLERLTSDMDSREGRQGRRMNFFGRADSNVDAADVSANSNSVKSEAPSKTAVATTTPSITLEAPVQAAASTTTSPKEEMANPFKGLGAAFNKARFGGAGVQPESAPRTGGAGVGVGGFGGFNRFRMGRMAQQTKPKEQVAAPGQAVRPVVSDGAGNTATATSAPAVGQQNKAEVKQV